MARASVCGGRRSRRRTLGTRGTIARVGLGLVSVLFAARLAHADDAVAQLDALVASQRPEGGWTFEIPPGGRPTAFTLVVKTAEAVLGPLGLAT